MSTWTRFLDVTREVFIFIISAFFGSIIALLILLLSFILLPFVLWRYVVRTCAKVFRSKELSQMVSLMSVLIGTDGIYNTVNPLTINTTFEVDSPSVSIETLRSVFRDRVLLVKSSKTEGLLYPELQSVIKRWIGYLFWAPCSGFTLEKQILDMTQELNIDWERDDAMNVVYKKLVNDKIWAENKPLWDIIVITNVPKIHFQKPSDGEGSLIIWRAHHLLTDGVALYKMFKRFLIEEPPNEKESEPPSFFQLLFNIVKFPFYFGRFCTHVILLSGNLPTFSRGEKKEKGVSLTSLNKHYPLGTLKEIRRHFQVDMNTIIASGVTGALRQLYWDLDLKPPRCITGGLILPMSNPPEGLACFATGGFMVLPVGEDNPVRRINQIWNWQSTRKVAEGAYHIASMFGVLPFPVVKKGREMLFALGHLTHLDHGVGITNMSYSDCSFSLEDLRITGVGNGLNMNSDCGNGILVIVLSYEGSVNILATSIGSVFKETKQVDRFVSYCIDEWETLREIAQSERFNEEVP